MPLKIDALQLQLERAQSDLTTIQAEFGEVDHKRQPKWRKANATVRQIENRIQSRQTLTATPGADEEEAAEGEAAN